MRGGGEFERVDEAVEGERRRLLSGEGERLRRSGEGDLRRCDVLE